MIYSVYLAIGAYFFNRERPYLLFRSGMHSESLFGFVPGTVTTEVNSAGSFDFKIYPKHIYFDLFEERELEIIVTRDEKIIFRGRPALVQVNNDLSRNYVCEGLLCELKERFVESTYGSCYADIISKPLNTVLGEYIFYSYGSEWEYALNLNNSFIVDDELYYVNKFDFINKLQKNFGGYYYVKYGDLGEDGFPVEDKAYFYWTDDPMEECGQKIEYGRNLQNLSTKINISGMIRIFLAIDGDGNVLEEANWAGNLEPRKFTTGCPVGGAKTVKFDSVTDKDEVASAAYKYASTLKDSCYTYDISAIDLLAINEFEDPLDIGKGVHIKSDIHALDKTMMITKRTYNLLNPKSDKIEFGGKLVKISNR